jgi:hypothetical protein
VNSSHIRWLLRLAVAAALIQGFGLSGRPVRAQDEGALFGEEADTTAADSTQLTGPERRRAESDSANARLFRTLHPSYTTDYTVARQTTNWNQNFTFGTKIGFMNFENKTDFKISTDSGRDETRRDGGNLTTFRMLNVPLNATLNLQRYSVNRPGEERSNDNLGLALSTRELRQRILGVDHNVSFSGGLNHKGDQSLLNKRQTRSTDAGLDGTANWKGSWRTWKPLNLDGTVSLKRQKKNSQLEQDTPTPAVPDSITTVKSPTSSVDRRFDIRAHADPWVWISSDIDAQSTLSEDESYLTVPVPGQSSLRRLEHRFANHRGITAGFKFFPQLRNFNLSLDLVKDIQDLDYRIRKDFAYTGDQFSWNGKVKAKWMKTDVDLTLARSLDQMDRATSTGQDTHNSTFEGKIARRIYSKLDAQLNWYVRANQLFFDDQSLDRDELRTKLQPIVTYKPNKKWRVKIGYIGSTTRRVEVNPSQAFQTRREEDYTVDMNIGYDVSQNTRLSQTYSIKSLYTTFDYNASGDRLLSTQRITTSLDTQLGPRCDFSLEHRFTLQDSGPFHVEPDGTRVFARDLRKYRQEMNASLKYKLNSWASALLDSQFLRTDDITEYTGARFTRRDMRLQTGLELEKTLRGSVSVKGAGQYVQSNNQDAYWTITSSLKKDF